MTEAAPWRGEPSGTATRAQLAAGRRWAARRQHHAPRTGAEALHDHDAGEAADEARQIYSGGNR